jgi:hypothetical protein
MKLKKLQVISCAVYSEIGGMYWIHLAQDRGKCSALVNTAMNFRITQNVGKFLNS